MDVEEHDAIAFARNGPVDRGKRAASAVEDAS
jgi:hypothetical protein